MKPTFVLVLLISSASLVSCDLFSSGTEPKKEEDKLPPLTQSGENTFGCMINGKALSVTNSLNMTAIYQGGFVQFGSGGVYFIVVDPFEINQPYDLTVDDAYKVKYTKEIDDGVFCFYEFVDTYEGTVTFSKIDKVNYIISGIFQFSTVTADCDTVRVTNGRFDIQYIP